MKIKLVIILGLSLLLFGCTDPDAPSKDYEDGYSRGYSDGYSEGKSAGYSVGYDEGYGGGYDDGTFEAYSAGYDDGYNDATDEFTTDDSVYGTDYESTWGKLIDSNGGTPVWGTLAPEQQALINYPYLDKNAVYYVPTGSRYHSVDWCYTLERSKRINSCTYTDAIANNLTPCSKCVGEY